MGLGGLLSTHCSSDFVLPFFLGRFYTAFFNSRASRLSEATLATAYPQPNGTLCRKEVSLAFPRVA